MASRDGDSPRGLVDADTIRGYLLPLVEEQNYDILDVNFSHNGSTPVVDVIVDSTTVEPIDMQTIVDVTERFSAHLDTVDMGSVPYELQVMSPGLDRPLTQPYQWERHRGRRVTVHCHDGRTLSGRIGCLQPSTDGDNVIIITSPPRKKGQPVSRRGMKATQIRLKDIASALIDVEFSQPHGADWDIAHDDDAMRRMIEEQEGNNK